MQGRERLAERERVIGDIEQKCGVENELSLDAKDSLRRQQLVSDGRTLEEELKDQKSAMLGCDP